MDTLARASHLTGDTARAVEPEPICLELLPPDASEEDNEYYSNQLALYEAALRPPPPR